MDRQLKQFVENIETNHPNILRIIRMHSYAGIELSHFSSDHVAWRDTLLDFYCNQDDSTKQSLLRWTDVATKGSIQFWRIPPAGFGVFFDIRSGQQWIIIATPNYMDEDGIQKKNSFSRWDHYIEFNSMEPGNNILEAIRLEPGNRL